MTSKSNSDAFALPPDEAARLYDLAAQVKQLAPWMWMDESEVFGVQHPETGEVGFISVMGMAGAHFAIAVYPGAAGLYHFLDLEDADEETVAQELLELPQLQASFEDRDQLETFDRDQIKRLGLKFRGSHAYPMFRQFSPGFIPWFIMPEDARWLAYALEQTLEVAPRVRDNPDILLPEISDVKDDADDETLLVRVPQSEGESVTWRDEVRRIARPAPALINVRLDLQLINELKTAARPPLVLEVDLLFMPMPIGERGERASLPYMLMVADAGSGMIVGFELMKVEDTIDALRGEIPNTLARMFAASGEGGFVPKEIRVRSEKLYAVMQPLGKTLNIKLRHTSHLPNIEMASHEIMAMMGGGF